MNSDGKSENELNICVFGEMESCFASIWIYFTRFQGRQGHFEF